MKITTPDDLTVARALADGPAAPAPRVGAGYDLHRLVEGRRLVLAGVEIPGGRGPLGHSDGDVVCHALTDAVLGAAAAGDIGRHFPDSDPAWKDAPGLDLLARAVAIVGARGFRVGQRRRRGPARAAEDRPPPRRDPACGSRRRWASPRTASA